jgi:hypothetical protein
MKVLGKHTFGNPPEVEGSADKFVAIHEAVIAPTVNDDNTQGYYVGYKWVDTATDTTYHCEDATTGAAVWSSGGGATDVDAIHDNVAGEIEAITEKADPIASDIVLIEDSADGFNKKQVQLGNLPRRWYPPLLDMGAGVDNGVDTYINGNAGYHKTFPINADSEITFQVPLNINGIDYDGSDLAIKVHSQLFGTTPSGGDNILLEVDYVFVKIGEDADTIAPTTDVNDIDVSTRTNDIIYTDTLASMKGAVGALFLNITMRRNAQGAGSDNYPNSFDIYALELIKGDVVSDYIFKYLLDNNDAQLTPINSPTVISAPAAFDHKGKSYNGVDQYETASNTSDVAVGTGALSVACWFRTTDSSGATDILGNGDGATANAFRFRKGGNDKIQFQINGVSGHDTAGTVVDGSWNHVVFVSDGSGLAWRMYLNGVLDNSGTMPTYNITDSGLLAVGARADTFAAKWLGDIDDIRWYDRAVTLQEIQSIKNNV